MVEAMGWRGSCSYTQEFGLREDSCVSWSLYSYAFILTNNKGH
jgi:hypothetical protein